LFCRGVLAELSKAGGNSGGRDAAATLQSGGLKDCINPAKILIDFCLGGGGRLLHNSILG